VPQTVPPGEDEGPAAEGAAAAQNPSALAAVVQGAGSAPAPAEVGAAQKETVQKETVPEVTAPEETAATDDAARAFAPAATATVLEALPTPTPAPAQQEMSGPLTVAVDPALPVEFAAPLRAALAALGEVEAANGRFPVQLVEGDAGATVRLGAPGFPGAPVAERFFAAVVPFDTVQDDITLAELRRRWQAGSPAVLTTDAGARLLPALLGPGAPGVVDAAALIERLEADRSTVGLIPFDALDPRFKVLTMDGINLLDNRLDPATYPLAVQVKVDGAGAALLAPRLAGAVQPATNRDPARLTTLVMTGVTAMSRATAAAMERYGYAWPAEMIGATLAAADITHISNEVPFLDDCAVNNTVDNLILCSNTTYWAALEAVGTDVVGLSGNHVNDFGRDGARRSLQWYKDNAIPIYGSGFTVDEACAPLLWEHNGNRFAFIAALAFGPQTAWVTESEPGACSYYEHRERILETVRALAAEGRLVAAELQFEEAYQAHPLPDQVAEFRALREAGAQIVTGVQSHVPQAQEPYGAFDTGGPGTISYGLGNLFFDQMWSWETRTELMARHTVYEGRVLSTEILTAVLEDYAQPRWATPDERADILQRIFAAAPSRP
jgi:poly-gamma-glutamate synthesis protein (capsule biosynthesis protein)